MTPPLLFDPSSTVCRVAEALFCDVAKIRRKTDSKLGIFVNLDV